MKNIYVAMTALLMLPACHVKAKCHWEAGRIEHEGKRDHFDILFDVNNASDQWMYLWMGHPNHGEDNGNLNLKPHSSATALGCSNGNGYTVTGIILTQGKDVLYTFDINLPFDGEGWVKMHPWKGGCYVAWDRKDVITAEHWPVHWSMSKMKSENKWSVDDAAARVRIDCV